MKFGIETLLCIGQASKFFNCRRNNQGGVLNVIIRVCQAARSKSIESHRVLIALVSNEPKALNLVAQIINAHRVQIEGLL